MFSNYYKAWKDQAKRIALNCCMLVMEREKAHYRARSYFASQGGADQHLASPSSFVHNYEDAHSAHLGLASSLLSVHSHRDAHPADLDHEESAWSYADLMRD